MDRKAVSFAAIHREWYGFLVMGGFSLVHWLIVLVIVMLLFGASRLSDVGKGLGEGIKNFKKGLKDDEEDEGERPRVRRKIVDADGEEVEVIVKPKQLTAGKPKKVITIEVDDDEDEDAVKAKIAAAKRKAAAEIEKDEPA